MTREITMIVVHCSATRCNHPYTVHQLYHDHVEVNHWCYIGYHFFISRDGKVHATRPLERMGAHARGWNAHSIGICYGTPIWRSSIRVLKIAARSFTNWRKSILPSAVK